MASRSCDNARRAMYECHSAQTSSISSRSFTSPSLSRLSRSSAFSSSRISLIASSLVRPGDSGGNIARDLRHASISCRRSTGYEHTFPRGGPARGGGAARIAQEARNGQRWGAGIWSLPLVSGSSPPIRQPVTRPGEEPEAPPLAERLTLRDSNPLVALRGGGSTLRTTPKKCRIKR